MTAVMVQELRQEEKERVAFLSLIAAMVERAEEDARGRVLKVKGSQREKVSEEAAKWLRWLRDS